MFCRFTLSLVVVGLLVGVHSGEEKKEKKKAITDQEKLQGEWRTAAVEYNGATIPQDYTENGRLKVTGDKAALDALKFTFTIDSSTSPKLVDITIPSGDVLEGIYKLDGNTLKICFWIGAAKNRPAEFAAPDANHIAYTFKR